METRRLDQMGASLIGWSINQSILVNVWQNAIQFGKLLSLSFFRKYCQTIYEEDRGRIGAEVRKSCRSQTLWKTSIYM